MYEAMGYVHSRVASALARVNRRWTVDGAQGTVEYVALVLLVALVMFGVVAAMKTYRTSEGQELGDLILQKIKEAVGKVKY